MLDQKAVDDYWDTHKPEFHRPDWALLKRAFETAGITHGRPPRRRGYEGYYQEETKK